MSDRVADRPQRRGRSRRQAETPPQPEGQPVNRLPLYALASPEQEDEIHERSVRILEEVGVAFYEDEALARLRSHGVDVDDDHVARFDRELIAEYVAKAPAGFVHSSRNPANNVTIGGDHMAFTSVAGPPFVYDVEQGRRASTLEDLHNFVKLAQLSPYLQISGTETVTPGDVPFHERALDITFAHFLYSDKPIMGHYPIGVSAADSVAMARIVFGERMDDEHVLMGVVNISSPRRLDDRMLGLLHVYAKARQALVITPFILAGAMGPAAILGTVAQANAEALATIAYTQMVQAGTPCIYGPFLAVVDLQSGAPVFGGAESMLAQFLVAQMARRYELPFRGAGQYVSSKVPDIQAGYEAVMSGLPSMMCKANFILHAAGWMENGLTASYEKFLLDLELAGMYQRFAAGVSWDEDEWAMDALLSVLPGGHHLGTEHTMARFRTAFHRTSYLDHKSYEQWSTDGAVWAHDVAAAGWRTKLEEYEQPPLQPGVEEALQDYMARRRPEIDPAAFQ